MFKSIFQINYNKTAKNVIRTKVVLPANASHLSRQDKIKLYNKENKLLFGPTIKVNKRTKENAGNSQNRKNSHQNKSVSAVKTETNESVVKFSFKKSKYALFGLNTKISPFKFEIINKMWQNTSATFRASNFVLSPIRNFQTSAVVSSVSSPPHPVYSSEDKILQIRQHQNDYAKQYPSVTLILNKTMSEKSKAVLDKWKKEKIAELGDEEFQQFYKNQMAVGTKLHNTIKTYFTQPQSQLRIEKDVEGVWNSVSDILKNVSAPKAIESNVVHPMLKYRGVFDAIADYEDKPTLIEWKKSDKPRKSILLTYDNPVQLAAYFGAICNDLNYKHLNVRDALLVIAYTDGSKADSYHLSVEKLREHWAQWLIRLEHYMENYDNDTEKILKGGKRLFEEDLGNLR